MVIVMGKGTIEAICDLIGLKGLRFVYKLNKEILFLDTDSNNARF